MNISLTQEQRQQLSAVQIQSLNILSMTSEELWDTLQKESEENPFMDYHPSSSNSGASEFLQFVAAPEKDNIKHFILEQLNPLQYTKAQFALLSYLAGCVDDDGFLVVTEEELNKKFHLPDGLFAFCLRTLQSLEPAGICAYDRKECLKLQLQRMNKLSPLLEELIDHHVEDIAKGDLTAISQRTDCSKRTIAAAIRLLKSLQPYPLKERFGHTAGYAIPDIIIRLTPEGGHEIELNDKWIENYSMSDYYIHMMHDVTDKDIKDYFQKKYMRCYMLLNNIKRRRQTLMSLAEAIWQWQYDYFVNQKPLRPMGLKDIAEKTGLHISTISRSMRDKYLQTPKKTVLLKSLFQRSIPRKSDGEEGISRQALLVALKNLVGEENPEKPYSDAQLVKILGQTYHIVLSRRVIQKYRNILYIPNSYERKNHNLL